MISLLKPKRGQGCGSKASHGETHSDETVIRRVARRLGRSWCFTEFPSAGASGGIALLWNASFVKTQVNGLLRDYYSWGGELGLTGGRRYCSWVILDLKGA
ncbi:uncharacterized protein LOC135595448 [Musa acuminata AAA Group]|uniref:uncharacterized protein LOC135595448 n=1 Tax=Musa acuminata AAA Group TaxID=214697 RepID=UPI0031D635AC